MKTICPHCQQSYEVELDMVGATASCQACGKIFTIKGNAPPPPAESPTSSKKSKPEKTGFKTPILSQICIGLGIVWSIFLGLLIVTFFAASANKEMNLQTGLSFGFGAISIFLGIVVFFGMAQVISAICETAYNTRYLRDK